MEILKKAVEIGKSETFIELTIPEVELMKPGLKIVLTRKRKQLERLDCKYLGQATIWEKMSDIRQEIKFLEYLLFIV
jgi:hypothetical protein